MLVLLDRALSGGVRTIVLEYRAGNVAAHGLYAKLGFTASRIRQRYYQDTGEDAVEAILTGLQQAVVRERLAGLREEWERRHGARLREAG